MDPVIRTAQSLFLEAIELVPENQWDHFVANACGADGALKKQVLRLLAAHHDAGSFMMGPAEIATPVAETTDVGSIADVGSRIGRYKLLEQIGEGGMGVVFVAEQVEPVRRRVALKIIKPGMGSRDVIARFEAERQALALMAHPNIATVLDGGVNESGLPYFVMELVPGLTIIEYCDAAKLTPARRVELFVTVCQAVQHAHQKGIIHRDLKPSNVLVSLHDAKPVPKIIDFGVAKAIGQQLTGHTVYTAFAQMIGTPLYMSPEQAEFGANDIDTRSDIYSLGVLLYELLTGQTPFDSRKLSGKGLDEMRRIIREDDPPKPSHRVSTLQGQALSTISVKRGVDERHLPGILSGELDWIVMKALEKERSRRYESASALAADLERYLRQEPVAACPPSLSYSLKKYARRHRSLLVTGVLIALSLVAGIAVSTWAAFDARSARKLADERLKNESEALKESIKQREQASSNLRHALNAVDKMLLRVAEERLADLPGTESVRRALYQDALAFYEDLFRQAPDDPGLRINIAKAWTNLGRMHDYLGDRTRSQAAYQSAIILWEALHAENRVDADIQSRLAQTLSRLGNCEHWKLQQHDAARPVMERALLLYEDLAARYPDQLDYAWDVVNAEKNLGANFTSQWQYEQAEKHLRLAVEKGRDLWSRQPLTGNRHVTLCTSLTSLVTCLRQGKHQEDAEVESLGREALERSLEIQAAHPSSDHCIDAVLQATNSYLTTLMAHGRRSEMETVSRRAVEIGLAFRKTFPTKAVYRLFHAANTAVTLADLQFQRHETLEALTNYRHAAEFLRASRLYRNPDSFESEGVATADGGILKCLEQLVRDGKKDDARRVCQELSAIEGDAPGDLCSRVLAVRAWGAIGDHERAECLINLVIQQSQGLADRADGTMDEAEREDWARAIYAFGDQEYQRSNDDRALRFFNLALQLNPKDSDAQGRRSQIFFRQDDPKRAIETSPR